MSYVFLEEVEPACSVLLSGQPPAPGTIGRATEGPLVSCLMVSRGNPSVMRHAIACFARQTYRNRQLVLVVQAPSSALDTFLGTLTGIDLKLVIAPEGLSLGDLRNMSIAHCDGEFVCQWDDDDLRHAAYLEIFMGTALAMRVPAVFLAQWTMWWPARQIFSLSGPRLWEGSMLAHRSIVPVYPAKRRGEDMLVTEIISRRSKVALVSAPHLYIYCVTGENTWDENHFRTNFVQRALAVSTDADYGGLAARLHALYETSDYEAYCRGSEAVAATAATATN